MLKFTKLTIARLIVTLAILAFVGIVVNEYLSQNPPEPNSFLGRVWNLANR